MLLQCFECVEDTRTLASLAQQSGLYKSTILRLANSMSKMGFLLRRPDGLFAVGPELTRFSMPKQRSVDVDDLIYSSLKNLADTKYSVLFCVRRNRRPICLFREDGNELACLARGAKAKVPLNSVAILHVLRAYSRYAKDEELMLVRERGWAFSVARRPFELAVIAVPVLNRESELLGALAVAGHPAYLSEERQCSLRPAILKTAQTLSSEMRFLHPPDLIKHVRN